MLISGGSRGIGFALVQAMVSNGAQVTTWSRQNSPDSLRDLTSSGRLTHEVCDVRDEAQVQRGVQHAIERNGPLTGCIASAGVRGDVVKLTDPRFCASNSCWETNFMGTLYTLQAVARVIIERRIEAGRLVAIGSLSAKIGASGWVSYSSSKSALTGLVRSLAQEMAPYGTTVNLIVPGLIETEMNRDLLNDRLLSQAITRVRIPMRRWGKPSDLVGICVYLMSDLSSYHTGDTVTIDGGYSVA